MKQQNKRVFILGEEGTGWSIDKDRYYTIKAIQSIEHFEITDNIFISDIIYVVWWNKLFDWKFKLFNKLFNKKIIATITNDLSHQENLVIELANKVDVIVYANSKQKDKFIKLGIQEKCLYFNPFYVDEKIFKKLEFSKEEICTKFGIDFSMIKGKKLIGSFQRDSLGEDLSKPKWQKDPDMLIDIMKKLDKKDYILLLTGPRRHYVINKCKRYNIDYIFVGDESYIDKNIDDLDKNALTIENMPYLYNLIDLYLVSSRAEGGPKAIPESILCGCSILSTDVGFAKDFLDDGSIYSSCDDAIEKILNKRDHKLDISKYYTFDSFKLRIENILEGVTSL